MSQDISDNGPTEMWVRRHFPAVETSVTNCGSRR